MAQKRKTHAIIFSGPERVIIDEVDIPDMTNSDVLIEIEYSSISNGTERWCLTDQLNIPGQPGMIYPHVPGYQAAGIVRESGSKVTDIKPGERVFSRNCRKPDSFKGSWWGGHVGVHIADRGDVIKLPEEVSTFEASSLLLAQVGYNGASKPRISPQDVAVVIGGGLVGQYAGQVLQSRNAHVIISDILEIRLEKAIEYSADEIFDNSKGGLQDFIHGRYPQGVPIVLETASSNKTVRTAIDLLGHDGQLVLNGFYSPSESMLDWHWLRRKEITTYSPDSRNRQRLEATLRLLQQGHIKVKELVTHTCSYTQAHGMYGMLLDQSASYLGIILDWKQCPIC